MDNLEFLRQTRNTLNSVISSLEKRMEVEDPPHKMEVSEIMRADLFLKRMVEFKPDDFCGDTLLVFEWLTPRLDKVEYEVQFKRHFSEGTHHFWVKKPRYDAFDWREWIYWQAYRGFYIPHGIDKDIESNLKAFIDLLWEE